MSETGLEVVSCGHFSSVPDHSMHRPAASDYLFIWVIGGRGRFQTEGVARAVGTGTLLTFRKGLPHAYASDPAEPWHIVWFHFDGPAAAGTVTRVRQAGGGGPVSTLRLDDQLCERWLELIAAHRASRPGGARLADHLLWAVLGLIRHRLELSAAGQPTASWQLTQRVQRYVREHLAEPITVPELARTAHVSPRQLTRVMRATIGCAPMAYVLDQRIAQAATLLRQTAQPIKKIAAAVGYEDPYHFTRLFKRRTGQSPTAYRRAEPTAPQHGSRGR